MEPPDADQPDTRPLRWWALLGITALAILLTLWTWHKWDAAWIERSEAFFPPEWSGEDLETLAWQYPVYRSNDSYQWVHLADALAQGNRLPLRHRFDEGPPEGRPTRWHSGLAHLLSASGRLVAAIQDWPAERGIHRTAHWLGALIHLCALIGGTLLISTLAGRRAALLFAGLYLFNAAIAWDFAFSRLDHEAVFQFFFLFHLIGLAGVLKKNTKHPNRWALLAGIPAGFCWWISATVMTALSVPTTLGLLIECQRRRGLDTPNAALARSLRIWGASAAAMILFFCLFDARLSSTASIATLHPIFIPAQAGAALVCLAALRRDRARRVVTLIIGLICGLGPLAWLVIHGADAHPWLDPMMRRLHDHIVEFQSPFTNGLWAQAESVQALLLAALALFALSRHGLKAGLQQPLRAPRASECALQGVHRPRQNSLRACWLFIPLTVGLLILSLLQARWLGLAASASALALCLHLPRAKYAPVWALSLGLLLLSASTWAYKWITIEKNPGRIFVTDLMLQVGARDINLNLQRLAGDETIHVAMPYAFAATSALFPEVHPIGTFYWENATGIRASADFFAGRATDAPIDYAVVQGGIQGAPFAKLANWVARGDDSADSIGASLAWRLSSRPKTAGWVEVPFHGTFGNQQFSVRIFHPR